MAILIIAEHDNGSLKSATLNTVTAAKELGEDVHILIAGHNCQEAAKEAAKVMGVSKVLVSDDIAYENQLAENVTPLIMDMAANYSHILAPATTMGKNLLPRVSALLDVQQISEIIAIEGPDTFQRPIYAGVGIATIQTTDEKKVLTVRGTAFDAAAPEGGTATIENINATGIAGLVSFLKQELSKSERPELTSASIVVSGGRGVGSAEHFDLIEQLADKLGAAVGASRAAVDAGWVPNDYQVGQTGKQVAPDIYFAIGISGAIQHLAGMKDSKVIVAINKDEDAPIFDIADYGIVGDLFDVVPQLIKALDDAGIGHNLKKKPADPAP